MSLINQMLQELDARRASVAGAEIYGQQVRAVPEHRGYRFHPAWWVALALVVVLCVVIAWILLRAPVTDAPSGAAAQLPLKLDMDMNAAPAPVKKAPPTEPVPEEVAPVAAATVPERVLPAPVQAVAAAIANEAPLTASPAPAKAPAQTETPARDTVPKSPEAYAPVVIGKQVRELTQEQRAENEYRKSVSLLQQGKAAESGNALEHALQLDPHHVAARQTWIGLLLDNKRQEDAARIAREGLALDSAQPGLAMILARLQVEKGELRPAIDTLEHTLAHAADRADYQAFLAALLQRDERHKQAVEHYRLALQKAPNNGVWWMGMGISLQADQRPAEAQEAFKRAKASNGLSQQLLDFVDARLAQLGR